LCEGALIATSLDPFDHYAKYPLVSHSVTPNTAALLSLRATGRQLGNIGNIFAKFFQNNVTLLRQVQISKTSRCRTFQSPSVSAYSLIPTEILDD